MIGQGLGRRIVKRRARIFDLKGIPGRIDARGNRMKDVFGTFDIGVRTDRNNGFRVQPRRAHAGHQSVIDIAGPRGLDLNDRRQRRAPVRKTDVMDFDSHLGDPVVKHRLMAEPRQNLMIGVGAGLVIAVDRAVVAMGYRGHLDFGDALDFRQVVP